MDIKLNFINESNDQNNSEVVIFQKNVATDFDELAVAWRVIKNCGVGDHHPFTFSEEFAVGASDSYGNYTPQNQARYGQRWEMIKDHSGDVMQLSKDTASSPNEVEVANSLQQGAIDANIYRDGKLLAVKTGVSPAQKAVFSFKPTIFVGVVSEVVEGEVMNSAIISEINTEISLLGISSADIVMTGGGTGPNATPFQFELRVHEMA